MLMMPVDVPRRAWVKAPVSWDGEAGGPLCAALRRSRSCSPWKVLRLELPRGKRVRSGVLALMLCAEGEAAGTLWGALREQGRQGEGSGECQPGCLSHLSCWQGCGAHSLAAGCVPGRGQGTGSPVSFS